MSLSSLGSLLTDTSMRLSTIANSAANNPQQIPRGLKQVSSLVNITNKSLLDALKKQAVPTDFDQKEIKRVLADINKLKQHIPLKEKNDPFVRALKELQDNLKDLAKHQKEMPPVQLKLGKTSEVITNGLSKHLLMADEKLAHLNEFEKPIPFELLKDLSKILDKASVELMKAEAFKASPNGIQLPSHNAKVIQRILENIRHIDQNVSVQVMAATYKTQVSKFKESLKELEKRLYVLNLLKKTRGKQTSLVEKETR